MRIFSTELRASIGDQCGDYRRGPFVLTEVRGEVEITLGPCWESESEVVETLRDFTGEYVIERGWFVTPTTEPALVRGYPGCPRRGIEVKLLCRGKPLVRHRLSRVPVEGEIIYLGGDDHYRVVQVAHTPLADSDADVWLLPVPVSEVNHPAAWRGLSAP